MRKKFEDILDIINGKSQKRVENPNGIYPIYGSGGVMGYADDYLCDANTVVIGRKGSINNPIYVEEPFWNVDTAFGLVARKNVLLPRYLYFFCVQYDFDKLNTTVTIPSLTRANLLKIEMDVPNIDEQKKIVDKLDCMVKLIQLQKRQIEQLDTLVKSRFVEMFGDSFTNPMRWEKKLLGDVCDVRDGTHDTPQYYESGYPLVTSKNVTSGKIDISDCSYICEKDFVKINERSKVDIGDIIMPMIGTVGKPVIVTIEPNFAIKNVALIKFNNASNVDNIYIKTLLESDYFDRSVLSKIRGGTQKFIALGDIRKLEILLPTIDKQKEFRKFVEQVDQLKSQTQKSLDKTQLLFNSLMQQYFG